MYAVQLRSNDKGTYISMFFTLCLMLLGIVALDGLTLAWTHLACCYSINLSSRLVV
jgi:hypothetical protein